MIQVQQEQFPYGYTAITELNGMHREMLLDFGILRLREGERWDNNDEKERAFLLISGTIQFSWNDKRAYGSRVSCFDENPVVLHVPAGTTVIITAESACELAVEKTINPKAFAPVFYSQSDIRSDIFGKGTLGETSIRTVRTVFDGEIAPDSNMVLGEVINHPGKWSSYPPHDHPQPEIYHYRFFPEQGFGISLLGENPRIVKNRYSSMIAPDTTHSQAAAPGYAMYYIWMIPHLPDDRWLPTTRYYVQDHAWLLEKNVKIWPERPFSEDIT